MARKKKDKKKKTPKKKSYLKLLQMAAKDAGAEYKAVNKQAGKNNVNVSARGKAPGSDLPASLTCDKLVTVTGSFRIVAKGSTKKKANSGANCLAFTLQAAHARYTAYALNKIKTPVKKACPKKCNDRNKEDSAIAVATIIKSEVRMTSKKKNKDGKAHFKAEVELMGGWRYTVKCCTPPKKEKKKKEKPKKEKKKKG